jgi:hypothetical protein
MEKSSPANCVDQVLRRSGAPGREALPAKHRASLSRLEGYGGFFAALRAGGSRLGFGKRRRSGRRSAQHGNPLRLTRLAPFRFVLELLIVEEKLFTSGEDKIPAAVNAL